MRALLRQLRPAILITIVFTVICGVAYPLLSTAIGQVAFHDKANGSLIKRDGVVVGSELIGQTFTGAAVLPLAARPPPVPATTASASSGSNLGPTNPDLLSAVKDRVDAYRKENGLAADAMVPVDAVTASASGLDPAHLDRQRTAAGQPRRQRARTRRGSCRAARQASTPTGASSSCSASRASTSSS